MPVVDSFDARATRVEFPWPVGVTGLERIMLSANGDLQRLLSAFFANPIEIERVYAETSSHNQPASPAFPIKQKRQVHLICASRIVCVATSTVTITSPECERLFIDEKFPIGQVFRKMQKTPQFTLLDIGVDDDLGRETNQVKSKLWRRYTLHVEGLDCHILESFPDRDMFFKGETWLNGSTSAADGRQDTGVQISKSPRSALGINLQSRRRRDSLTDTTQGHSQFIFICLTILLLFFSSATPKNEGSESGM